MFKNIRFEISFVAFTFGLLGMVLSQASSQEPQKDETTKMAHSINGTFDVKLTPADTGDSQLAMMLIDKTFSGMLEGKSVGRMLAVMTEVEGSAGYVAMERVMAKLDGKSGTFVLQHSGTMSQGKQSLSIDVVPDSGTGDLKGLRGKMTIDIKDGKHSYRFDYSTAEDR